MGRFTLFSSISFAVFPSQTTEITNGSSSFTIFTSKSRDIEILRAAPSEQPSSICIIDQIRIPYIPNIFFTLLKNESLFW